MKKERAKNYPVINERVVKMKAEKLEPIKAHTDAIAKLLYEETDSEQVNVTPS
ncbi:MAG: hypothetical protein AAFW67_10030 [Cyanobacteria bacterium J06638_38]